MTVRQDPARRKRKWLLRVPPFRQLRFVPEPPAADFPGAPAAAGSERAAMAFSASAAYLTHQQKVLRLYKRALRHLESWCIHRWERGTQGAGS